jgi:hypothetical protein
MNVSYNATERCLTRLSFLERSGRFRGKAPAKGEKAEIKKEFLMKRNFFYALGLGSLIFLAAGCATSQPVGLVYTDLSLPKQAVTQGDVSYTKTGTAKATSVLGLVTSGDASLRAAIRNGQITTVKYVDYSVKNVLGVYGEYTVTVYGD